MQLNPDLIIGLMSLTRVGMVWVAIIEDETRWPRKSSFVIFTTLCISFLAFIYVELYLTAVVHFLGSASWVIIFLFRPIDTEPLSLG